MKIECACTALNPATETACWKCKRPITDEQRAQAEAEHRAALAVEQQSQDERDNAARERVAEAVQRARESGDWSSLPPDILNAEAGKIVLTTAYSVASRETDREIDVITAECVFGMNVFRDFFAAARDFFGGRSVATQKVLRDARQTALLELRKEALRLGADAVIAIDLDYQELSGGQKGGMLMIVASGTAVRLLPEGKRA